MTTTRADRAAEAAEARRGADPAEPGTDVAVVDPVKHMIDTWMPNIEDQMPLVLRANSKAWARVALTGLRNSKQAKQLAKCDRPSLYAAFLEAARFGLTPFTDEAAIIPYGSVATFVPMAQGFVRMFWNTGQVAAVVVDFIRKGEVKGRDWNISRGSGGRGFWHEPRYVDEEGEPVRRGDPILAYCYLTFKDGSASEPVIVDRWDAEEVMTTRSKAWHFAEFISKKRDSLWHTDFNAMWLKTAVRRAAKYGPKSAELQELLLIEAREDRTRDDAPQPPAAPMGEGAGVDWTLTVDGGNVVPSTVVGDDGFPAGSQPAGNGGGQGRQTEPAAPAPVTRTKAMKLIGAVLGEHGITASKADTDVRRAIISAVLHMLYKQPGDPVVLIKSQAELSDDQAIAVAGRLAELIAQDKAAERDVEKTLRDTARMTVEQAARAAGGQQDGGPEDGGEEGGQQE